VYDFVDLSLIDHNFLHGFCSMSPGAERVTAGARDGHVGFPAKN
jgi:hypothetical protein